MQQLTSSEIEAIENIQSATEYGALTAEGGRALTDEELRAFQDGSFEKIAGWQGDSEEEARAFYEGLNLEDVEVSEKPGYKPTVVRLLIGFVVLILSILIPLIP